MPILLGVPRVRTETPGFPSTADRPSTGALVDRYGRVATDLRVSLTDRCNLRCTYCMPAEGLDWLPTATVLSDDEVIRLLTVAVERLGVREIRFTGGEPLLRKGLERIVAATTALRTADGAAPETSLTTNGLGLQRRARGLAEAGLTRINVSLDSIDPATFAGLTRRNRLPDVLAGLAAADEAGLRPVKVNAVLMRGINDDEAPDLLDFALGHGYQLRFIEQMPLGPRESWERGDMVTADEVLTRLRERFTLVEHDPSERGSAPAQRWSVLSADGEELGTVGIIASVSRPFCGACDRTRLTADGQMRDCLFARGEYDLRTPLRRGDSDEELAELWRAGMWGKRAGHGIDDPDFLQPARPMSAIGG
ncbi:MAG TPA: GTP 3',8-cyclase MoaA [Actinomycetaceae bacterium]|nr:GTP 3',8-cyclase MoaA [Actinomycetaceae bacterium]